MINAVRADNTLAPRYIVYSYYPEYTMFEELQRPDLERLYAYVRELIAETEGKHDASLAEVEDALLHQLGKIGITAQMLELIV